MMLLPFFFLSESLSGEILNGWGWDVGFGECEGWMGYYIEDARYMLERIGKTCRKLSSTAPGIPFFFGIEETGVYG